MLVPLQQDILLCPTRATSVHDASRLKIKQSYFYKLTSLICMDEFTVSGSEERMTRIKL